MLGDGGSMGSGFCREGRRRAIVVLARNGSGVTTFKLLHHARTPLK